MKDILNSVKKQVRWELGEDKPKMIMGRGCRELQQLVRFFGMRWDAAGVTGDKW